MLKVSDASGVGQRYVCLSTKRDVGKDVWGTSGSRQASPGRCSVTLPGTNKQDDGRSK